MYEQNYTQQTDTFSTQVAFFPNDKTDQFFGDHDQLTGLYNKNGFMKALSEEMNTDTNGGLLLVFDIDDLKRMNILHGRFAGDSFIKLLADLLNTQKRDNDILCRLHKDKFALALTNTSLKEGYKLASRIHKLVSELHIICNGELIKRNVLITALPYIKENKSDELLTMANTLLTRQKSKKAIPAFLGK